tara:strand:- start:5689 stop:6381 length:693 start_codon:yes stop_codon:yes gene_type:complete
MADLTHDQLVDEVQGYLAKDSNDSLVDDTRASRWVNEGIRRIIELNPGLKDASVIDTSTVTWATDDFDYLLAAWDVAGPPDYKVGRIKRIKYIDTTNEDYHSLKPYIGGVDAWDARWPYPPAAGNGIPEWYIVRDFKQIEVIPVPGSDQNGKAMYLYYDQMPGDIATTETPVLTNFNEQIIHMALAVAYRAMRKFENGARMEAHAQLLVATRMEQEGTYETADAVADFGP